MFIVFIVLIVKSIIDNKNKSVSFYTLYKKVLDEIGRQFLSFAGLLIVLIIICIPVSLLTNSAFQELIGLHNLYLEDDGHYCYSIRLYEYDSEKSYILPAEIEVDEGTWYLRKFVKPDGSVYSDDFDQEISFKISPDAYDKNGIEWASVHLLNEHTSSIQLYETNRINAISIISLLVTVICCPFWLYIIKRYKRTTNN